MFISTVISNEKYRYNYGRKWDKAAMLETNIKLPVKDDSNPDWEFMENYIKSRPYSRSL